MSGTSDQDRSIRQRAEQLFRGPRGEAPARENADAALLALREKTEKLRALRLARAGKRD